MNAYLELHRLQGSLRVALDGPHLTVGRDADNDLPLPDDGRVSARHAVFTRYTARWSVRDLTSSNGTFVNGRRVFSEYPLWHGDQVRLGASTLIYRHPEMIGRTRVPTGTAEPPEISPRERDVLLLLCAPLLRRNPFIEPASTQEIADTLVISTAAVKGHLAHLYGKFGLRGERDKRVRLANAAIRTGAISEGELPEPPEGEGHGS